MIATQKIPPSTINGQVTAQKKKKRRTKKKKTIQNNESSSESESENEDLRYMTGIDIHIDKNNNNTKNVPKNTLSSAKLASYHGNQLDNPVTVTIKQVMGKSNYSHERVASCVNRMWDTGLKYDSPEAVLAELQREDDKKLEEQEDYDEILDGKRRAEASPPVPLLPPPVQVQTSQSSSKQAKLNANSTTTGVEQNNIKSNNNNNNNNNNNTD
mmetsp:Transcript_5401/g.5522  ORF Transcript_5401/g.5522 Transcript_5401/m.5522 type:complete len:213 (-) Transcript_5401:398-1036(-)